MAKVKDETVKALTGVSRIHIPVALPPLFLGAPQMPAFLLVMFSFIGMMTCFIMRDYMVYGLIFMIAFFPLHGLLIFYGRREPHMETIMEVYTKGGTKMRAKHIGSHRTKRRVFFPG